MTLVDKKISALFDLKIFLDIKISQSIKRREKITYNDESVYNNEILIPMHNKYVLPTKKKADLIIDVGKNNEEKVYKIFLDKLQKLEFIKF